MDQVIHHGNGSSGHEHREANPKLIVYSAIGLAIVVAVVMLLMWGTFNLLKTDEMSSQQNLSPLAAPYQLPPEPRLEEHPRESLRLLREREDRILNEYQWQDQKSGVVRIPIEHAMDIIAQRGFPATPPPQKGAAPNAKR